MNRQMKRHIKWEPDGLSTRVRGHHPPGTWMCSPSQKLLTLLYGRISEVSSGRRGWLHHQPLVMELSSASLPSWDVGGAVCLILWLVFLGTSTHPEASRAPPHRSHLSSIQKTVNFKGFRSSETCDKDQCLSLCYTKDVSWSFIVFTKCSFILVFKKSNVFTHA